MNISPRSKFWLSFPIAFSLSLSAHAYITTSDTNRAVSTVYNNGTAQGDPAVFTWSIMPDGSSFYTSANISNTYLETSDTVSYWDTAFGVAAADQTADLTNRPWFTPLADALNLISKRCGVTYVYEPNDDGGRAALSALRNSIGKQGVRGDLRFAGSVSLYAGGISSSNPSGYYHPPTYMNTWAFTSTHDIRFIMVHEVMHALGFGHNVINNSLSQSAVAGNGGTANGPQFDDIYGLHRKYGDVFEKNGGNDTLATATDLGSIAVGGSQIIGNDADGTTVSINEFDFISIDSSTDTDFLKFTITEDQNVTITLDPRGPTYTCHSNNWSDTFITANKATIIADQLSDLSFKLYSTDGTLLHTVSSTSYGASETLVTQLTAGDYYAEIKGAGNTSYINTLFANTSLAQVHDTQLYAFKVQSDGAVTSSGYSSWVADNPGLTDSAFDADADGDGVANGIEYVLGMDNDLTDASSQPTLVTGSTDLVFSFNRNAGSTSDTLQFFQYSEDLQNWTDVGLTGTLPPEVSVGTTTDGLEPISITIDQSQLLEKKLFWRLKVDIQE